ncbi:hypothetical protein Gpo141_00008738 [Globisporangium polare]
MATYSCSRLHGLLAQKWEHHRTKVNGQYSVERLRALNEYATRVSFRRSFAVILLTPLLCLTVVIVADAIPLEAPERGFLRSYGVWVRWFFTTSVFTFSALTQCEFNVRPISFSFREKTGIVVVISSIVLAAAFPMGIGIGYPVPFTMVLTSCVIWFPLLFLSVWLTHGSQIRQSDEARNEFRQFANVCVLQAAATVLYQAFYAAFSRVPAATQSTLVLVLPGLKVISKIVANRIMDGKDDLKPDVVTFNVELFHSMFVSCCMQRSTSIATSFVLIGMDFVHASVSQYKLSGILSGINSVAKENGIPLKQFVAVALRIASSHPSSSRVAASTSIAQPHSEGSALSHVPDSTASKHTAVRAKWFGFSRVYPFVPPANALALAQAAWIHPMAARPSPREPTRFVIDALSASQQELFVNQFLRAMLFTELLLLVEFVEVMVPVTYCAYLVALIHLPNRVYYPYMTDVDGEKLRSTIQSVLLYATMELVSFIALTATIRRRLPISGIHQLAFVLEKHAVGIQAKLTFWVLYVLQSTLIHLGADYSFQFAWLHPPASPSP